MYNSCSIQNDNPINLGYFIYPSYIYIIFKCLPQIILWGLGTALGELPPYLLAYECDNVDIDFFKNNTINNIYDKIKSMIDFTNKNVIFTSILLMASWPNLTFDMCGILCGYYKIKISDFLIPTIIGKALIKAPIQSLIVLYFYDTEYNFSNYSPILFNISFILIILFLINKFIEKISKLELEYKQKL